MKKSYTQLIIVELILLIFLFLNNFVTSILSRYNLVICLLLMIILFKYVLGVEKDYHGFIRDVIVELFIFLLVAFLGYYGLGFITGFYRAGSYINLNGFNKFILPISLIVILKEILRYMMLMKANGSKILTVTTVIIFVLVDVSNYLYYNSYGSIYEISTFLTSCLVQSIFTNILCSYMAIKINSLPNIILQLILNLAIYVLPIFPDMNDYFKCFVLSILPMFLMFKMSLLFAKYANEIDSKELAIKNTIFRFLVILFAMVCVGLAFGGLV